MTIQNAGLALIVPEQKEPNIFLGETDVISYQSKNLDKSKVLQCVMH